MDKASKSMDLEILDMPVEFSLKLNELRMIVNCFRAVAYQMELDDEPYLDSHALLLKAKLERTYLNLLHGAMAAAEAPAALKVSG